MSHYNTPKVFKKNKDKELKPEVLKSAVSIIKTLQDIMSKGIETVSEEYPLQSVSYTDKEGKENKQYYIALRDCNSVKDSLKERTVLQLLKDSSVVGGSLLQGAITEELNVVLNTVHRNAYTLVGALRKEVGYALNPTINFINDKEAGTCHQYLMIQSGEVKIGVRVALIYSGIFKEKAVE